VAVTVIVEKIVPGIALTIIAPVLPLIVTVWTCPAVTVPAMAVTVEAETAPARVLGSDPGIAATDADVTDPVTVIVTVPLGAETDVLAELVSEILTVPAMAETEEAATTPEIGPAASEPAIAATLTVPVTPAMFILFPACTVPAGAATLITP